MFDIEAINEHFFARVMFADHPIFDLTCEICRMPAPRLTTKFAMLPLVVPWHLEAVFVTRE